MSSERSSRSEPDGQRRSQRGQSEAGWPFAVASGPADFLATQQLGVIVRWTSSLGGGESHDVPAIELGGLDFPFLAAFLVGLYAMHRLALVREEGEAPRRIAPVDLVGEVGKAVVEMSALPGLRQLSTFPYGMLRLVRERRRRPRE